MPWQKLVVEVSTSDCERVEQCVMELGALSISLEDAGDQPLLEPAPGETPMWSQMRLIALFPEDTNQTAVTAALTDSGAQKAAWEQLEDREWERVWLDDFEPVCFGGRLWVCPDGLKPADAQYTVRLDPGLAFGTGRHPTTSLCLEWLAQTSLQGCTVLDYGCGSGILGLAAAVLGARRIYAVDIDQQALIATRANAGANDVASRFVIAKPDEYREEPVDIAIANILSGPLISLAETLAGAVRPGGAAVLSGILDDQAARIRQAYEPWFEKQEQTSQAGWVRLTFIRNDRVHTMS